jgi:hypothetical protein
MLALLLSLVLLAVLGLAVLFGLTPDSRQPGPWYPGLPDRSTGDDTRHHRTV